MLNEAKPPFSETHWEFWEQWNTMAIKLWSDVMKKSNIAEMDSPGVSHAWMELAQTIQKHLTKNAQELLDPQEAWKLWFDVTLGIWRIAIKMGGDPFGTIACGIEAMEHMQEKTPSGESTSFDPFALFNTWYDATSKPWASMVEDLIASKQFLAFTGPFLENYTHLTSAFHDASEAYFKMLRLPTLPDITRVAELIISLEEKVDDVAETIECVKAQTTRDAIPTARITDLEQRLNQIETRLDKMLALLEKEKAQPGESTSAGSSPNKENQLTNEETEDLRKQTEKGHSPIEAVPFATNDG